MEYRIRIKRNEDISPLYSHISINESQAKTPPPKRPLWGWVLGVVPRFGGGEQTRHITHGIVPRTPHDRSRSTHAHQGMASISSSASSFREQSRRGASTLAETPVQPSGWRGQNTSTAGSDYAPTEVRRPQPRKTHQASGIPGRITARRQRSRSHHCSCADRCGGLCAVSQLPNGCEPPSPTKFTLVDIPPF
jgi:hypothetical protein